MRGGTRTHVIDDARLRTSISNRRDRNHQPADQKTRADAEAKERSTSHGNWRKISPRNREGWMTPPDAVVELPDPPRDFVVPDSHEEYSWRLSDETPPKVFERVGRSPVVIVQSKIAACNNARPIRRGTAKNRLRTIGQGMRTVGIESTDNRFRVNSNLLARVALPPSTPTTKFFRSRAFQRRRSCERFATPGSPRYRRSPIASRDVSCRRRVRGIRRVAPDPISSLIATGHRNASGLHLGEKPAEPSGRRNILVARKALLLSRLGSPCGGIALPS